MSANDILTMLTSEDSARVTKAIMESVEEQNEKLRQDAAVRMLDHEFWKEREKEKTASQLRLDHAYRWHVYGASILNMISTAAIVLLVLKVMTVL